MGIFSELEPGKRLKAPLLCEVAQVATTKNGDYYQKLILRDTDGVKEKVNSFLKKERFIDDKVVIEGVIECSMYEGNKTFTLKDYDASNEPLTSFRPKARIDIDKTWKELSTLIKSIKDERYCRLACKVLSNELTVFKHAPLTASDEYSRVGGLMEATYSLMQLAEQTASIMNLDRDVLLAAAAVYYCGSTLMVDEDYQPTKEVALTGYDIAAHDKLMLANSMISNEYRLDDESFKLFDNILLSRYHGKPTASLEAFTLKMLDSIVTISDRGEKIIEGLNEGIFSKETDTRLWYKKERKEAS